MSDNRNLYTLEEVCTNITDGAHASPKENINGEELIATVKNMTDFGFDLKSCKKITKEDFQKLKSSGCIPNKGDVLFSKDGTIGKVIFYNSAHQIGLLSSIAIFRPDQNLIDGKFLSLYLRERSINEYISSNFRSGSAIPRIILRDFKKFELKIPPLPEQKAIAAILTTLDDKIELNLQMNKTLEEMAMALYKHWFVDFGPFQDQKFVDSELGMIPEGWEVKTFSTLFKLKKGLSYKSKFYSDDGFPMINLKCFSRDGGFRHDGVKYYNGEYKDRHVVKQGDLMIAMTDLTQDRTVLGSPIICPNINTKSVIIASLDIGILEQIDYLEDSLILYFYYKMRTNEYHQYILGYGNGSTVMHLDKNGVLNYESIIPSIKVIKDFNSIVQGYRNQIDLNIDLNKTIVQLRDTLLPKLISGEVRLKEIQKAIEQVL